VCLALFIGAPAAIAVEPVDARPKVAIIVGPVAEKTDFYRSVGEQAASEARRWTPHVVTVFSPDATWPRVRAALHGASIVVYLGHGNGWPSPYGPTPKPRTQNGLGLNPVAGGDDSAHQYFGEEYLATQVRLAPHAVVLLHHLCYASGNSEPGRPESARDVAQQRVDNYAAGWIRAGAAAVVADAFGSPAWYIRALFTSDALIREIWTSAPTYHDHLITFASVRSTGFEGLMDPTWRTHGFYRSMVWRPGLGSARAVSPSAGSATTQGPSDKGSSDRPAARSESLAESGFTFEPPGLRGSLVIGTKVPLTLQIVAPTGLAPPRVLLIGVRWSIVDLDSRSPLPAGATLAIGAGGVSAAAAGGSATSAPASQAPTSPEPTGPVASPSPGAPRNLADDGDPNASALPPETDQVEPETLGDVIEPVRATATRDGLTIQVTLPTAPGRYRLTTTLHRSDGVAYDAATQALIAAEFVRVSAPLGVAYGVTPFLIVSTGATFDLPVRVSNPGNLAWSDTVEVPASVRVGDIRRRVTPAPAPLLVARWLALNLENSWAPAPSWAAAAIAPGTEGVVTLSLEAPSIPGSYLLMIDVVSPLYGSLAGAGMPVAIVSVAAIDTPPVPATPQRIGRE
jgi:hypothetical protein